MMEHSLILHGTKLSGHVHRVELLLRMLDLPCAWRDAPAVLRSSPDFLALNSLGQIPVLEDGSLVLADSNAILVYLAKHYDRSGRWLPDDPIGAAQVQRWLSIAAGELCYGPAHARMLVLWNVPAGADPVRAGAIARRLLAFMDDHLATHDFLAADRPTIADLACYAYVAHAPEGGVSLDPHGSVRAWLARVEALPGFFAMPRSPLPVAV